MNTLRQQEIFWIILKDEPLGIAAILAAMINKISIPS
jgi:hypothetical protein